jgi:VanZ family protein
MRILGLALGWGWAVAIVWLSVTPSPPQVDVQFGDKIGHFGAYGLLMFWFTRLYVEQRVRALYAMGFIALGVAIEFVQGGLGYRSFEVMDMAADAIGVLLGWGAALILKKPVFR